ncbi:MAG: helix-turn-helix transcriptional regulator [Cyanobacterium sp. T60_A2020_053]|nr:helix-turn-helix transcriptional regulator [Cyanobacterium sp. T60_A2020_053]
MSLEQLQQPIIGDVIKALRLELKLSQEKFASELGVSFSSLNRWENHRTMPSILAMKILDQHLQQLDDRGNQILQQTLANK